MSLEDRARAQESQKAAQEKEQARRAAVAASQIRDRYQPFMDALVSVVPEFIRVAKKRRIEKSQESDTYGSRSYWAVPVHDRDGLSIRVHIYSASECVLEAYQTTTWTVDETRVWYDGTVTTSPATKSSTKRVGEAEIVQALESATQNGSAREYFEARFVDYLAQGPVTVPLERIIFAWLVAIATLGYMLPWAIAVTRLREDGWGGFSFMNGLFGWTVIYWILSFFWAFR